MSSIISFSYLKRLDIGIGQIVQSLFFEGSKFVICYVPSENDYNHNCSCDGEDDCSCDDGAFDTYSDDSLPIEDEYEN